MSKENPHWKQKIWTPAVLATALLVGSMMVMGLIVLLASWIETWGTATPSAPPVSTSTRDSNPRSEESMPSYATQRPASTTGGFDWPSSPSRRPSRGAGGGGGRGGEGGGGLSSDQYQAALESGKKVYLPNPSGECNLGAGADAVSAQALDGCFSKQAKAK